MKGQWIPETVTHCINLSLLVLLTCVNTNFADWQKMDPPPDADKAGGSGTDNSCWLATASNLLAGAGYGNGATVQERADDIYSNMKANYGIIDRGWTDTAISWWLGSSHNTWSGSNPYTVVSVYGNKSRTPWDKPRGSQIIGTHLRNCNFVGLSISSPRTSSGGSPSGGHAITCWGDNRYDKRLRGNPEEVILTDSDRDTGGDIQRYTYDDYSNPNPSGFNEGDGWYMNYSTNHPFIKHIAVLSPTDDPTDSTNTQVVTSSYRIHQSNILQSATDLHYQIVSNEEILSYNTSINWETINSPVINESGDPRLFLSVDWDLSDRPVPYCRWVDITVNLIVPASNTVKMINVYFTYPLLEPSAVAGIEWELFTPNLQETNVPDITGGYVVGSFDVVDSIHPQGPTVVGEFRFLQEYDYFQDPELHQFKLWGDPNVSHPFDVVNFKFGHSYGVLDHDELWAFDDWMTRIPVKYPLHPQNPVILQLNWENRLPYPVGEIYLVDKPQPPCTVYLPQDYNLDCCVNFLDLAFFSNEWLSCTLLPQEP